MQDIHALQYHVQQMLSGIVRLMPIMVVIVPMVRFLSVSMILAMEMHLRSQMHDEEVQIKRGQRHCEPAAGASQ